MIFIRLFGQRLANSFVRFHIDNVSAMYCCLNAYSSNSYMARLSGEVWMLLLSHNIVPWFQYVPSKLNVADIFSRPDRRAMGRRLAKRHRWKSIDPSSVFRPISNRLSAARGRLGGVAGASQIPSIRWAPSLGCRRPLGGSLPIRWEGLRGMKSPVTRERSRREVSKVMDRG